jgi:hypothetical protein
MFVKAYASLNMHTGLGGETNGHNFLWNHWFGSEFDDIHLRVAGKAAPMTRHQRRKRARLFAAARERSEIVRSNLSAPADRFTPRGRLVSGVYEGENGRARGTGVVPMTHKVSAVITRNPVRVAALYPSGTRIIRAK